MGKKKLHLETENVEGLTVHIYTWKRLQEETREPGGNPQGHEMPKA